MVPSKNEADFCPHCRKHFKIIAVKFRLGGTQVVAACPNCALVGSDVFHATTSDQWLADRPSLGNSITRLNIRSRDVVGFLFGALLTAAALRHGLHIHGGLSPETIRAYTLITLAIALPVAIAWRISRRSQLLRRSKEK